VVWDGMQFVTTQGSNHVTPFTYVALGCDVTAAGPDLLSSGVLSSAMTSFVYAPVGQHTGWAANASGSLAASRMRSVRGRNGEVRHPEPQH
jgi:hypothetical protein